MEVWDHQPLMGQSPEPFLSIGPRNWESTDRRTEPPATGRAADLAPV